MKPLMRVMVPVILCFPISAASAESWLLGGEFGEYGCLHCKLAGMMLFEEGADSVRFEAGTGRDLRNYAPDRPADLIHMKLKLDIPDMNVPRLTGEQTLTLSAIAKPMEVLMLNAEQMQISSVTMTGDTRIAANTKVTHSYDGEKIAIRFDPPLPPGEEAMVRIDYVLESPADGLFWTAESPEWKGRPAQIHTQGQPETNRFWFPSHDFPNERLTTEIITTVPEGYMVSANGREATPPKTEGSRTTYHWLQDKSHVSYLVSMIVGKFDVVDVAPAGSTVPMPVWVPPGMADRVKPTYGRTADMLKVFEERFGEPYPWDRYGQICVWNFGAGGMENTSVTTMYDTAYLDEIALQEDDLDGLIAHELAHQWFGDLITCNTWAHIWLNEGWATYSSSLWAEARDGHQNGYVNAMWRTMRGIARSDQIAPDASAAAQRRPGMVSTVYKHPWETFRRVSNPYPKGSSILHMLRMKLGEELFFGAVAEYVDQYKLNTAETHEFRRVLEQVSGVSLEQFFTQWTERPGTPKVSIRASWNEGEKALKITLEQKQFIDAELPAFVFDLPIEVHGGVSAGDVQRVVMRVDGKRAEQTITLGAEPAMVLFDPDLHVLMDIEVDAPAPWLINQLATQRSIASRLDAANSLRSKSSAATREALVATLKNTDEFWSVRAQAAESLGKVSAFKELAELVEAGIDSPKVRRAALRAMADGPGEIVAAVLKKHASGVERFYSCRASALESLAKVAKHEGEALLPLYVAALQAESQHDQVRIGAINGLETLDHKKAFEMVIPYTQFGTLGRTRPQAISAVAKLAKHDPAKAYETLAPLVFDSENRARRAAFNAIAELKDAKGLELLDRVATSTMHEPTIEAARAARDRLAASIEKRETIDSAQVEIEKLKADLKRLEKQVEEK